MLSFTHSSSPSPFPAKTKFTFSIYLSFSSTPFPPNQKPCLTCFSLSLAFFLTFSVLRSPEAALLRVIQSSPAGYPHSVYQPLPGPCHHLYHLYKCHHHVSGALQPATGDHASRWVWKDGLGVGVGDRCSRLV